MIGLTDRLRRNSATELLAQMQLEKFWCDVEKVPIWSIDFENYIYPIIWKVENTYLSLIKSKCCIGSPLVIMKTKKTTNPWLDL